MALGFAEAETTEAYMRTLRGYLDQYGRPVALSIFRVNQQERASGAGAQDPGHPTHPRQHPPGQGPGGTGQPGVQDAWPELHRPSQRLPARVHGDHNRRFRVLHDAASLDLILSLHSTRKLSRNLTLRYQNREYQILNQGKGYRLRSASRGE